MTILLSIGCCHEDSLMVRSDKSFVCNDKESKGER